MWISMNRKEETMADLKCAALAAACMAVLLVMMLG